MHKAIRQLEHYTPLAIYIANFFKAAQVVADLSDVGIKVDWLDRAIPRIYGGREFQLELQKTASLKVKIKEVEVFLQELKNLLKQTEENLAKMKKHGFVVSTNNQIKIL